MHSAAFCELSKVANQVIKLTKVQAEKLKSKNVINHVLNFQYSEYGLYVTPANSQLWAGGNGRGAPSAQCPVQRQRRPRSRVASLDGRQQARDGRDKERGSGRGRIKGAEAQAFGNVQWQFSNENRIWPALTDYRRLATDY